MAGLLDKLKKNSKIDGVSSLEKSKFYAPKNQITTNVPAINLALSGSLNGGLMSGLTLIAGPSKHFKSSICLVMAAAFQKANPDGVVLFYDSEFGSPAEYFKAYGVDPERVLHTPITDIEQLKFDIMSQLDGLEKDDKVLILIDSIGNLASKKEVEDALNEKSAADMTRAKQLKSLFRMVTPHLTIKNVPMLAICHVYQTQELYAKTVISGGCLAAGSEVMMADGSLRAIEMISVGDEVATLDGPKPVTQTWNPDTLEDGTPQCVELSFEDGHSVVCSLKHPFMVREGNRLRWVKAVDLDETMEIHMIGSHNQSMVLDE